MAPTVYVSDLISNPSRSHLNPDTLDDFLEGGLRVRRRHHRPPGVSKERRTRGSVWLQSSLMGPTVDDLQQQARSREEDEYRSEDSLDCRSPTDKNEKWSREEILEQQRQQNERLLLLRRREGLLDITVRTVNLVRRNQQLQNRLAALQAETRAFIRSVLDNPENQEIREQASRSRRKSRSEDENEDNSSKKLKLEAVANTVTATNTTTTITTTDTKVEQGPDVLETASNQK